MKKIRLSSPAESKTAWGLAVFLFLLIALILFSLRRGLGYFLLLCLCSLLAIALVAAYLSAVIKAAVEIEGESHLKICGLVSSTVDYSGAVSVKTSPVAIGPIQSRAILLCDSQGQTVCSISTMFTANEGVMAELPRGTMRNGLLRKRQKCFTTCLRAWMIRICVPELQMFWIFPAGSSVFFPVLTRTLLCPRRLLL